MDNIDSLLLGHDPRGGCKVSFSFFQFMRERIQKILEHLTFVSNSNDNIYPTLAE